MNFFMYTFIGLVLLVLFVGTVGYRYMLVKLFSFQVEIAWMELKHKHDVSDTLPSKLLELINDLSTQHGLDGKGLYLFDNICNSVLIQLRLMCNQSPDRMHITEFFLDLQKGLKAIEKADRRFEISLNDISKVFKKVILNKNTTTLSG